MKEPIKAPEKIQLSNEVIANLSYLEFKTLVTMVLTELVEYDHKIGEKVKAMQNEIKCIQGTNSNRRETRTQINDLEQEEEINIQLEQNEETRITK